MDLDHVAKAGVGRGGLLLGSGRVVESLYVFDNVLRCHPQTMPHLWQRGLALYYGGRFAEGAEQFEMNMQVNGADAEEILWRFACDVNSSGVGFKLAGPRLRKLAATRACLDGRVPMEEALLLFGGEEALDAAMQRVMDAAEKAAPKAYGDEYGVEGVVGGVYSPMP
jgi:hypothetical protein